MEMNVRATWIGLPVRLSPVHRARFRGQDNVVPRRRLLNLNTKHHQWWGDLKCSTLCRLLELETGPRACSELQCNLGNAHPPIPFGDALPLRRGSYLRYVCRNPSGLLLMHPRHGENTKPTPQRIGEGSRSRVISIIKTPVVLIWGHRQ